MSILTFKKVYLIHGKQRLERLWVFQPWFLSWNAGVIADTDLKRTQKQVKMGYSVSIYKTLWNNFCSFSRDFVHGTRWTSPPFYIFVSVMNDVKLFELQRFWATNSTFPCDHQNQLDKPSLTYCVTWLCKLFSLSYDLFRGFYKLESKLVNVTN